MLDEIRQTICDRIIDFGDDTLSGGGQFESAQKLHLLWLFNCGSHLAWLLECSIPSDSQ